MKKNVYIKKTFIKLYINMIIKYDSVVNYNTLYILNNT